MLLAACSSGGLGVPEPDGRFAPASRAAPVEDGLTIGHRLMAARQYELALDEFRRAAIAEGVNAETLSAMGTANLGLGRLGQAESMLRRAAKIEETNPAILNNLGVVLMEAGKDEDAVGILRQAFALDSGQSPEIRDNLALALAKLEDPGYKDTQSEAYKLVRRGSSEYVISEFP